MISGHEGNFFLQTFCSQRKCKLCQLANLAQSLLWRKKSNTFEDGFFHPDAGGEERRVRIERRGLAAERK